jgi:hypothetical protein
MDRATDGRTGGRTDCLRKPLNVERSTAWVEDTALLGSNRSADPEAKTEGRAMDSSLARLPSIPFGIGTKAKNPPRRSRESGDCELPGDGLQDVAISVNSVLHFTLNQYTPDRPA